MNTSGYQIKTNENLPPPNTAKIATEKGFLVFHMSIPSHSIKINKFIPILTYMKYNKLLANALYPKSTKICSKCRNKEHT